VILVDTAVWVDHFRDGDPALSMLLERGEVLAHPWITGTTPAELLGFIEHHELYGVGYVDAQLLAATKLTADARLWTHDRRLSAVAGRLGAAYPCETAP
jgi:predicted nucleic acid-binding protein